MDILPRELWVQIVSEMDDCSKTLFYWSSKVTGAIVREDREFRPLSSPKMVKYAAINSHLGLLQWLMSCRYRNDRIPYHVGRSGCRDMIQWLMLKMDLTVDDVCDGAARGGHVNVLEWLKSKGCQPSPITPYHAARSGSMECLSSAPVEHRRAPPQWTIDNGCRINCRVIDGAARGGHLDMLQWMRRGGFIMNGNVSTEAATGGHIEVLQWSIDVSIVRGSTACQCAALKDRLDVLKWLIANGFVWNEVMYKNAVYKGHIHILEYITSDKSFTGSTHQKGMSQICPSAALGGQLKVLKWAVDRGMSIDTATFQNARKHSHIMKWFKEQQLGPQYTEQERNRWRTQVLSANGF